MGREAVIPEPTSERQESDGLKHLFVDTLRPTELPTAAARSRHRSSDGPR